MQLYEKSVIILTMSVSLCVLILHAFGEGEIGALLPSRPIMVISTAICFLSAGVSRYCLLGKRTETDLRLALSLSFVILGMMLFAMVENLITAPAGISVNANTPSVGTMASFMLFVAANLIEIFDWPTRWLRVSSAGLVLLAGIALAGHILHIPALYFHHASRSNGMAILTASLFVLLGTSLMRHAYRRGGSVSSNGDVLHTNRLSEANTLPKSDN